MATRANSRIEPPAAVLTAARRWLDPVRRALGSDFLACYLTGSVLRQGFDPRRSRVNLLVLSRRLDGGMLETLAMTLPPESKSSPRFDPVFMSEKQMRGSVDAFPIEWLEIQEAHLLLEGQELLGTLQVPRHNLRLQCEHELRVKLLRMRQTYLLQRRHPAALEQELKSAASSFATLFRTLLRLRGESVPAGPPQVVERVADLFGLEARALLGAYLARFSGRRYRGEELLGLYRGFLAEVERLVTAIDELPVG